jgi:hypothetical protein
VVRIDRDDSDILCWEPKVTNSRWAVDRAARELAAEYRALHKQEVA